MNNRDELNFKKTEEYQFLLQQKKIRVAIDQGINYGNQASTINIMRQLIADGFSGIFEIVYDDAAKSRLLEIVNADSTEKKYSKPNFTHTFNGVECEFIEHKQFAKSKSERLAYGFTGGFDKKLENFAKTFNVETFARFSPYTCPSVKENGKSVDKCGIYKGQTEVFTQTEKVSIINNDSKPLVTPTATLAQSEEFLLNNKAGKKLLKKRPVIGDLIDKIKDNSIDFLPIYGQSMKLNPTNVLTAILAGRYYQLNEFNPKMQNLVRKPVDKQKPMVVSLMSDFQNLDTVKMFINDDNYGGLESLPIPNHAETISRMRQKIKSSELRKNFVVIDADDETASEKLKNLKNGEIAFLITGTLHKQVFDGITFHEAENTLPRIIEGAGAISGSYSHEGESAAHIRCRPDEVWPLPYDKASPEAETQLKYTASHGCSDAAKGDFFGNWRKNPQAPDIFPDVLMGQFFIDVKQRPDSPLATFFKKIKSDAKTNNRVTLDLTETVARSTTFKKHAKENNYVHMEDFTKDNNPNTYKSAVGNSNPNRHDARPIVPTQSHINDKEQTYKTTEKTQNSDTYIPTGAVNTDFDFANAVTLVAFLAAKYPQKAKLVLQPFVSIANQTANLISSSVNFISSLLPSNWKYALNDEKIATKVAELIQRVNHIEEELAKKQNALNREANAAHVNCLREKLPQTKALLVKIVDEQEVTTAQLLQLNDDIKKMESANNALSSKNQKQARAVERKAKKAEQKDNVKLVEDTLCEVSYENLPSFSLFAQPVCPVNVPTVTQAPALKSITK